MKLVFGLMCTIILLLALDTSIARLYTLIYGTIFVGNNVGIPTEWNTFGFTLITAFCLVGQFIILKAVTERTKEMRTKGSLHLAIVQKISLCGSVWFNCHFHIYGSTDGIYF